MHSFEMGRIRPPSEAYSILLRLTRSCPWNRCAFCMSYEGQKFSQRSVEEVKGDIDSIYYISRKIAEELQKGKKLNEGLVYSISKAENIAPEYVSQVAFWMQAGMKSLFIQDGDSLAIKAENVVAILNYVKEKFPSVQRITTYARSKTLSKKKPEDLKLIREAGLDRLHCGMESGSQNVLNVINKGVTPEEHIIAGKKAMEAGFELSEFFMPGAGGTEFSEENAVETARVLNEIKPTFIRIRTNVPVPGTELHRMMQAGEWSPVSEEGKVKEIRTMIEKLEAIDSYLVSDHMMNLIEDVEGKVSTDKQKMLDTIDRFLNMDVSDRESYIVGRRIGHFRYLADYRQNREVDEFKIRLKNTYGSLEKGMAEVLTRTGL